MVKNRVEVLVTARPAHFHSENQNIPNGGKFQLPRTSTRQGPEVGEDVYTTVNETRFRREVAKVAGVLRSTTALASTSLNNTNYFLQK